MESFFRNVLEIWNVALCDFQERLDPLLAMAEDDSDSISEARVVRDLYVDLAQMVHGADDPVLKVVRSVLLVPRTDYD